MTNSLPPLALVFEDVLHLKNNKSDDQSIQNKFIYIDLNK